MDMETWMRNKECADKILIVRNLSYGKDLITSIGFPVFGVKVMTLDEIARGLCSYALAQKKITGIRLISGKYGAALLRNVLLQHTGELSYYQDPSLLDQAGADEIYRILCIVRSSSSDIESELSAIPEEDHPRILDLCRIRELYEQAMQEKNVLDPCAVMHIAAEAAESLQEDPMFYAETAVPACEERYYSFDEKRMLSALARITNADQNIHSLELPSRYLDYVQGRKPEQTEITFARGFGTANEVKHVIYDMLKHNYAYGDICILYASSSMEPWLLSELEAAEIPYAFADGRSLSSNAAAVLLRAMLTWACNGFTLQDFRSVLSSSCLNFDYAADGETGRWRASSLMHRLVRGSVCHDVSYMVGWGYERYVEYLRLYRNSLDQQEMSEAQRICAEHAADLLESILDLFAQQGILSCGDFAEKMIAWVDENIPASNMARKEVYSSLCSLRDYLVFAGVSMPALQVYSLLNEELGKLQKTEEESGSAVLLKSMNHPSVMCRKHIYAIGMSASNMSGNTDESPVLNDREMQILLHGGYLPLISTESTRCREEVLMTLGSLQKGTLKISWPDFDTQDLNLRNPAVMVLDLQKIAGTEESEGFSYGIPEKSLLLQKEELVLPVQTPSASELNEERRYSATALEEFCDCPRAWYYDAVCGMGEEEIPEYQPGKWLDNRNKGNFIHAVLEQYAKQVFGNSPRSSYPEQLDENVLKKVCEKVRQQISEQVPDADAWIMEREVKNMTDVCREYLETVHRDYSVQGWEFLCAEMKFEDAQMSAGMDFLLNGRIDRIDAKIDRDHQRIVLRTIDYKTGKPDRIRKKCTHGTALQREVYISALQQEQLQAEVCTILSKRYGASFAGWKILAEEFFYVFPLTPEDSRLPVFAEDSFSLTRLSAMVEAVRNSGTFPDRFTIGTAIEEQQGETISPQTEKLLNAINGEPKKRGKGRKKSEENCKYCAFAKLCSAARV